MIQLPQRFRTAYRLVLSRFDNVSNKIKNYEIPEKFKGTFLQRWANYWRNLYVDYKDVAIDVAKDCKERPVRAAIYSTLLGGCFYFSKHNPDEIMFRDKLIESSGKLIQVGEPIRNPVSVQHIRWLEQCYNEGITRRLNLGLFSLMWINNYDKDCFLYKAVCPYLKPKYLTFHERIIDIGVLDKWWILETKMNDYDVNESEFNDVKVASNVDTVSPS